MLLNILLWINSNKCISWSIPLEGVLSVSVLRRQILSQTEVSVAFAKTCILPKWHLTKTKFLPFLSLVFYWTSVPYWQPCHANHLELGITWLLVFLMQRQKSLCWWKLWLHAFKHVLGAWFTKLSHRLASSQGVHRHFLSLRRKGLKKGKAWNMKVLR